MENIFKQTFTAITRWKWPVLGAKNTFHAQYQPLTAPSDSPPGLEDTAFDVLTSTKQIRPLVVFDSPSSFFKSISARLASLWTPSFMYALLGGQILSLSVTCASVTTTKLVERNWILPSTQTFFSYFSIFIVFTPYTIYKYEFSGWIKVIKRDGWKYFLLAVGDLQGNFLAVKAFGYTDLLSCMLLDAWAIPVCLFVSRVYMGTRYHWTQVLGVAICVCGMALLVVSDLVTGKDGHAENRVLGDALMVVAATIFGISNATEEFFVRHAPLYEVVGQLGLWATLVGGIQAFLLERDAIPRAPWDAETITLLVLYTLSLFTFFSLAPLLFRTASSSYLNMSLLTSDFYGLVLGLLLFHYSPYWLYFPAFAVVMLGLVVYFWHATPEEQGESDVRIPPYVSRDVERCPRCPQS